MTMEEDEAEARVIPLRPGAEDDLVLATEKQGCYIHSHFTLDTVARRVFCRDCGQEVDAFTALDYFASNYDRYRNRLDYTRNQLTAAEEGLNALLREEKNAKARKRRREPKEVDATALKRQVTGALRSTVDAHGPIEAGLIESASRRITHQIVAFLRH